MKTDFEQENFKLKLGIEFDRQTIVVLRHDLKAAKAKIKRLEKRLGE